MQVIEELEKALRHLANALVEIEEMPDSEHIRWAKLHVPMSAKYAKFALKHLNQGKEE